jgi:hypothetical protein
MNLLTVQFSPASNNFLAVISKYSPQLPVLEILNLCSSLRVRDQVAHPYRKTGTIVVLHILIFKFLERRQEDKRF